MRLLVLGGTQFIGRAVVETALARGDEVTIVHRGRTGLDLFAGRVERLLCDRAVGLGPLRGRAFDAVIDTSCLLPEQAAHAVDVLEGAVERYVLLSSGNVYADHGTPGIDEDAALCDLDSAIPGSPQEYGARKAVAEGLVLGAYGDRALVARSGLVAGPNDHTARFSWWVDRIARGGLVLVPEPGSQPVQLIDVRDLAAFLLAGADGDVSGVLNVAGPREPLHLAGLFHTLRAALGGDAELAWIGEQRLRDAGVRPWSDLPLWLDPEADPGFANFMAVDLSRAMAAGLTLRPIAETARDTLAWLRAGHPITAPVGLSDERERELLGR